MDEKDDASAWTRHARNYSGDKQKIEDGDPWNNDGGGGTPMNYQAQRSMYNTPMQSNLTVDSTKSSLDDLNSSPLLDRRYNNNYDEEGSLLRDESRMKHRLQRLNTRLLEAVENGDMQRINRLLRLNANPNATCELNHVSACHLAALKDNDALSLLIKAGADSNRTDKHGRTPLHMAAWSGNYKPIAILLGFPQDTQSRVAQLFLGPKVEIKRDNAASQQINAACKIGDNLILPDNWKDSMEHHCSLSKENHLPPIQPGWTPLHSASARAHYSCAQLLVAAGADVNARDLGGRTPLDIVGDAYYSGYTINSQMFTETIKILVAAGGSLDSSNKNESNNINTPLHTAVEIENEEAIKKLLAAGASVAYLNSSGLTAMHICVNKQLGEHLQLLTHFICKNKALSIDMKDKEGLTTLHAAVKTKWVQGVRITLGAGANIFRKSNDGETPFHTAAAIGYIDFIRGILTDTQPCNINLPNDQGHSALFIATIHNHLDIVKLLIQNNASVKILQPYRLNALHVAAKHGRTEILEFFLNYEGYDKDITSLVNDISEMDRYTPIVYAVVNNHPKCVELLLRKNAQINIRVPSKDEFWTTPLHIAAEKKHYEIAKQLIEFDSRIINSDNTIKASPLHEACLYGNREMIKLLVKKGANLAAKHHCLKTPLEIILLNLTNPTEYMEEILDSCISINSRSIHDKEFIVTVNYEILLPNPSSAKRMQVIESFVNSEKSYGQRKLLHHPVIQSFLYLEWKALLPLFYTTLILFGAYILALNMYVVSIFYYTDRNKQNTRNVTQVGKKYVYKPVPDYLHSDVWKYLLYVTVTLLALKELFFIKLKNKRYFLFLETWVKLTAIMLSMVLPSVVSWETLGASEDREHSKLYMETARLIATIAVLLSWVEMMFLLSRLPKWGYYALMFGNVAVKVLKVLLTFGFVIFGFSLSFMIQFRAKPPFDGPWAALTKTFVMMTSEYDYSSTINKEFAKDVQASIIILRIIFIVFVVLASIVLMNLMVGIAVNDVNELKTIGNLKRLQKQIETLTSMESLIYNEKLNQTRLRKVANAMRKSMRNRIELNSRKVYCVYVKQLPKHITEAIFEKAIMQQKKQIDKENSLLNYQNQLGEIQNIIVKQDDKLEHINRDIERMSNDMDLIKQLLIKRS